MWFIWWPCVSCVSVHPPTAHSVKSSPSPDPEESGAKDELLYRWGHHWSWVVCKDVLCIRCTCTCMLLLSRVFVVPFPVSYCSVYFLVHIHSTGLLPTLVRGGRSQPSLSFLGHLSAFLATSPSEYNFYHFSWQSGQNLLMPTPRQIILIWAREGGVWRH